MKSIENLMKFVHNMTCISNARIYAYMMLQQGLKIS